MTLAKTKSCSKIRFRTDAFAFLRAGDGSTPTEADTYGLTDRLQRWENFSATIANTTSKRGVRSETFKGKARNHVKSRDEANENEILPQKIVIVQLWVSVRGFCHLCREDFFLEGGPQACFGKRAFVSMLSHKTMINESHLSRLLVFDTSRFSNYNWWVLTLMLVCCWDPPPV